MNVKKLVGILSYSIKDQKYWMEWLPASPGVLDQPVVQSACFIMAIPNNQNGVVHIVAKNTTIIHQKAQSEKSSEIIQNIESKIEIKRSLSKETTGLIFFQILNLIYHVCIWVIHRKWYQAIGIFSPNFDGLSKKLE